MSADNRFVLTILETSDVHGNILPLNYANNKPMDVGLAKIATLLQKERHKNPYMIVIDNGDLIQGTPLTYYHARIDQQPHNPMVLVLNELAYDAAVLGNHDFNYGLDVLGKAIRESNFPWLSANVVKKGTGEPFFGKPYLVKHFPGDLKVGVLGLTTQYIPIWEHPRHIEGMDFLDAVEAAKRWVKLLREKERVDVVIVSYHGGFERDLETGEPIEELTGENQAYQLCQEVEGIDVLLTGHQHRSIAGKSIHGVTVVQPSSQGRMIGKVTVELRKQPDGWQIVRKDSELLSVKHVVPDPHIVHMVQPYEEKTQLWLDKPIGKVRGDMRIHDPMLVRLRDHAVIEFFNKVQMEYAHVDISATALFDNASPGFSENISMRDIVTNYMYPNTLRVIRIKGKDIKAALEKCASYFAAYSGGKIEMNPEFTTPKPQHYNYDMWEGIEYKINISRPLGERVVLLNYKGKPIEMEQEYDVVMNSYRAGGGGNYRMFKGKPIVRDIPVDVVELIAEYIMERGTIEATVDHNWEVIHD
ncbi:2',3'-cyclic-nucleotide 2'-phosphodiesterase [Collibacillus ludicampi]|uniref:2',3'-cyclic-nucleotide 2'-phosphodiesterase n=1 Tax=Collibacillus ludicampi TaxID=2771369 RepID=A0AAV4LHF7_9BACL|nr:bifunctional UDP-sugar hydrolase/5'-nucleotidase [Collibacillus ludicampi]GIM47234.1 2',3'-cyclic-nucleotide 2'-phosphodiesterase [Collibacillus ludicampi]